MQKPADLANSGTSTARDSHLFCVNLVNLVQVSGLYERTAGHPRLIPKGMACTYVRSEGKGIPRQHHESYGGGERQRRQRRERERGKLSIQRDEREEEVFPICTNADQYECTAQHRRATFRCRCTEACVWGGGPHLIQPWRPVLLQLQLPATLPQCPA